MRKVGTIRARLAAMLAAAMVASAAPAANVSAAPESPGTALSRHIRVLASNPRDFNSLIGAGRAALELGDVQAAAGFFGRAEESYPNAAAAKAGLGAAMAHMGDADGAIFYFDQASRLGASALTIALDRGLARDLNGDLGAAQSDYKLAIQALNSDEARRRLALSLAIARDRAGALAAIQPLLNRRDSAAQRTRAFVLALLGDHAGAAQAIESVMPGGSARFAPFFTYLPRLTIAEKAAAVHLGMFPENAATRVASVETGPIQTVARPAPVASPPPQTRVAINASPPISSTRRIDSRPQRESSMVLAGRIPPRAPSRAVARPVSPPTPTVQQPPAPSFSLPSTQVASSSPSFSLPSASSAAPTETDQAPIPTMEASAAPTPSEQHEPVTVLAAAEPEGGNLSGIDKLLATIAEAPPPPQPKLELEKPNPAVTKAAADKRAADKKAAERKAAEKKARDAKLAAEKKEREQAAKLGIKGTYWVQLAGGSNQDRMANEYRKLSAQGGKLLKSRSGYVTAGKDYFRLLIGPFDTKTESQAFVNKLAKEGVDGFSWTRTPAQIKIEKLSSR